MGWIKRNLFFVIGGAVALLLLGAGGFFIYKDWARNSEASTKLNDIYSTLKNLQMQQPSPGNEKINNTEIARKQQKEMDAWIVSAAKHFQAVPAIPSGPVTSEAYASALRRTIDQLQREADAASVVLPPKYDFSFSVQRPRVQFSAESLGPLASQLGEVKAISEALFSARVNALDSIQRIRVSEGDMTGPQGDYINNLATTNDLAVITPYVVTFRSFTPELARVISAFATSSNAFLIKQINVVPANAALAGQGGAGVPGGEYYNPAGAAPGAYPPGGYQPGGYPPGGYQPGGYQPGAVPGRYPAEYDYGARPGMAPAVGRGGLQTVLKEQLLQIMMEVDIVKLLPKKS
jgi:hypothetical protein